MPIRMVTLFEEEKVRKEAVKLAHENDFRRCLNIWANLCKRYYQQSNNRSYILKVKKLAESTHQARKIGEKSTKMATTKNRDKNT